MSFRTDVTAGATAVLIGVGAFGLSLCGLGVAAVYPGFANALATRPRGPSDDFLRTANASCSHILKFYPFALFGGAVLAAAGYHLYRGSQRARRVAQLVGVLALGWIAAVLVDGYRIYPDLAPRLAREQPEFFAIFKWVALVGNGLLYSSIVFFLLFMLRRGGHADTGPQQEKPR